jgi:thioredoxin reductase/NAD-dependent dihydropyrimidine dehydrogenase PreA subunit
MMNEGGPVSRSPGAGPGRRRSAPRAAPTSDVLRSRGLLGAAIVAAIAVSLAIGVSTRGAALRGPGPLARAHRLAGLACATCHNARPVTQACTGCHGAHASTRPGHRALAARGELGCPSCHAIHRRNEGVRFFPNGTALLYGSGWEKSVGVPTGFRPAHALSVALVPLSACARCHDLRSPRDPIAACRGASENLCFDEHRAPGATRPRSSERDPAWEAARVIAERDAPGPATGMARPLGWLGIAFGAAFAILFVTRRRGARQRAHEPEPAKDALPRVVRLPQIDPSTCLGCYACVDACPYDVIEVERYVAVVARPDACCGLTLCEQRCPNGSLVVREGAPLGDRPRVSDELEALDAPGVYLAGDLTGLPLIRNAIDQGARVARRIAASLGPTRRSHDAVDLVVVGAGPAGLSAALEARARGLSLVVLEQGSVAESIRSFPRGKLVFDDANGSPGDARLWLEECTKEELLSRWLRIVRQAALPIREGRRVESVTRDRDGTFVVRAVERGGESGSFRARRVLLAVGKRGTPRKLDVEVPEAMQSHVHYSLADARSFSGQRVLVVGLGDVAMEAAIALGRQPGTEVTISYRGTGHRRGKRRNIDELGRLVATGRARILFETNVERIDAGRVTLRSQAGPRAVACDALLVMIGSVVPWKLLERAGVQREDASQEPPPQIAGARRT